MTRQVPWFRVGIEGVVIVASILLAFGIDAWWEDRNERHEEQQLLAGLESDFTRNLASLRAIIAQHEAMVARVAHLESMSTAERAAIPRDSVWTYLQAMHMPLTFSSRDGTLDAVISSGGLARISDLRLRESLADWTRQIADVSEEATALYASSLQVIRRLIELRAPLGLPPGMVAYSMPGLPDARANYETAHLSELTLDEDLMSLVQYKLVRATVYLSEVRQMAEHADATLTLIVASRR